MRWCVRAVYVHMRESKRSTEQQYLAKERTLAIFVCNPHHANYARSVTTFGVPRLGAIATSLDVLG